MDKVRVALLTSTSGPTQSRADTKHISATVCDHGRAFKTGAAEFAQVYDEKSWSQRPTPYASIGASDAMPVFYRGGSSIRQIVSRAEAALHDVTVVLV